jgi:hypothetical protein
MTQPGETDGFDAVDHLRPLLEAAPGAVDVVLVHEGPLDPVAVARYEAESQQPVVVDEEALARLGVRVIGADLAERGQAVRHRPDALAEAVLRLVKDL